MSHILKVKNRIPENRGLSKSEFLKVQGIFSLLLCLLLAGLYGCATTKTISKEPLEPQEAATITGIDIQDNAVTITVSKPFIYTIYRPGDPYRIVVDLPDVKVGAFNKKIMSQKAGVAEILPSEVGPPFPLSRLEMLLQTPSMVEQEYKNNVLKMKIKEDLAEQKSPKGTKVADLLKEEKEAPREVNPNPAPPVRAALSKATAVSDISFDVSAGAVKVLIKGNGSMIPNVFPLENRIVIDIADVVLDAPMPSSVISPVKGIRSGKHDDKVRLVIDLKEKTNFDVTAIGDSIVVTLKRPEKEFAESSQSRMYGEKTESTGYLSESVTEKTEPEAPAKTQCETYLQGKENVNFDFQDQDIVPILRLFADISGCNLFVHPDVKGKATMKFRDVPWNQAFDTILKTFGLGKSIEGNIIRVAPYTVFAKESEERARAAEAGVKAEPLETKIFAISYADVSIVETAIKNSKILTPRGSLNVDKRTSSMLVKDVAGVFPQIDNLLATLDRPTPQVLIEARIVEVSTATTRDLGIQWGMNISAANTLTSFGGLSGVPALSAGAFTGKNFLVDFPSKSVGPLSGSGFSFGIINPQRTIGLDLQLSALETAGTGKVISNPKVLTVDNGKAKILQGQSIPVRKLTSEGTISTEFKDVVMEVNVTPHITPDKSITMSLEIKKEDLDFTIPSVEGVPGTQKKEANTNVIIKDGETVVIGGMYKITTNDSLTGVPGLMRVPILGWLFKNDKKDVTTSELLIFITPRILEKP
jgi:type IV pilus assembly protein PilQ